MNNFLYEVISFIHSLGNLYECFKGAELVDICHGDQRARVLELALSLTEKVQSKSTGQITGNS